MSKFVFSGGGTAGHALPSLRVADFMRSQGHEIFYVGSENSIEEDLCKRYGIEFHSVTTAKFDRSRKLTAVSAVFKNIKGLWEARKIIKQVKPAGVFSSGGFASVPVVLAARLSGIKRIVVHACDLSAGLANQLCLPFATHLSCTFPETGKSSSKAVISGPIVDAKIYGGSSSSGEGKPTLLIYGGSQGAAAINEKVRASLDPLLQTFRVIHVCGNGKTDEALQNIDGYEQHEYVFDFPELLKSADAAICRAGSNSLWELILTETPHLAVPLPLSVSRGDQIENCKYLAKLGATRWLDQEVFQQSDISRELQDLLKDAPEIVQSMKNLAPAKPATHTISELLTGAHE